MNQAEQRLKICKACDQLRNLGPVKVCGSCGCALDAKARLEKAKCPQNKWDQNATK